MEDQMITEKMTWDQFLKNLEAEVYNSETAKEVHLWNQGRSSFCPSEKWEKIELALAHWWDQFDLVGILDTVGSKRGKPNNKTRHRTQ